MPGLTEEPEHSSLPATQLPLDYGSMGQRHCPAPVRTDLAIRFPTIMGNQAQVKLTGLNQLLFKPFHIFVEDQNTALSQKTETNQVIWHKSLTWRKAIIYALL